MSESSNREAAAVASTTHFARIDPTHPAVISREDEFSIAAEHYRNLAFRVEEEANARRGQGLALAVTSPEPSTGKTLVSLNLALTLARGEGRVLLVEGDLRRPTLENYLQTFLVVDRSDKRPLLRSDPVEYGLQQVLDRHMTLQEATLPVWGTQLEVLLAGTTGNSDNVLAQQQMVQLLALARSRYRIVLIDSPPLILAAGRSASARAERTVLVVRAGSTKRKQIADALSLVDDRKLVGVVLNGVKALPETPYSHYRQPTESPSLPTESEDEPIWEPRVIDRPFGAKTGITLVAALLLAGVLASERQAGPKATDERLPGPIEQPVEQGVAVEELEDEGLPVTAEERVPPEATTLTRLNLRSAPSLTAPRLHTWDAGSELQVIATQDEWVQVRAHGREGWVHYSGLQFRPKEARLEANQPTRPGPFER